MRLNQGTPLAPANSSTAASIRSAVTTRSGPGLDHSGTWGVKRYATMAPISRQREHGERGLVAPSPRRATSASPPLGHHRNEVHAHEHGNADGHDHQRQG